MPRPCPILVYQLKCSSPVSCIHPPNSHPPSCDSHYSPFLSLLISFRWCYLSILIHLFLHQTSLSHNPSPISRHHRSSSELSPPPPTSSCLPVYPSSLSRRPPPLFLHAVPVAYTPSSILLFLISITSAFRYTIMTSACSGWWCLKKVCAERVQETCWLGWCGGRWTDRNPPSLILTIRRDPPSHSTHRFISSTGSPASPQQCATPLTSTSDLIFLPSLLHGTTHIMLPQMCHKVLLLLDPGSSRPRETDENEPSVSSGPARLIRHTLLYNFPQSRYKISTMHFNWLI